MLKVKNLQKRYGDFKLDCSLTVRPGRVTGLVGRNGSGKSTTFKAVLGLIRPDGGTVRCFGKDPQGFSAADRAKIGVVLPDSGFSGYLRGHDVVAILRELVAMGLAGGDRTDCAGGGATLADFAQNQLPDHASQEFLSR